MSEDEKTVMLAALDDFISENRDDDEYTKDCEIAVKLYNAVEQGRIDYVA